MNQNITDFDIKSRIYTPESSEMVIANTAALAFSCSHGFCFFGPKPVAT